jgi:hypothetical protein
MNLQWTQGTFPSSFFQITSKEHGLRTLISVYGNVLISEKGDKGSIVYVDGHAIIVEESYEDFVKALL